MVFQSLPISDLTLVDSFNSTTTPLVANATFTGIFSNLLAFPLVDVTIITDQPGTLFVDVSSDGVTVAQTTSFAVTSTLLFRSPFSWQYIRLRYTNGATAQTTFFLQFLYRPSDPGLASLPLNRTVSNNSIAPLNRAILNAQAPSGFYQNLQCDSSNILLVDVSNFPSTQSISGTVTANIGTTNGLALDATLTSGTAKVKMLDGSGTALTSTLVSSKQGLDVNVISSSGSGTEQHTVDSSGDTYTAGTTKGVVADFRVVSSAPTLTSGQFSSPTLTTAGRLIIDGSQVTQPISGTVTANIGTTNGLALDSSINGILLSQGSTTSGEKGILHMGAVTTAAPSYTTGQTSSLSLTVAGALRVSDNADGPVTPGTVAAASQLIGGQFNSTAPALTNTQQAALQLDASGNLLVNVTTTTASSSTPSANTISAYVSANKAYVTAFNVNMPSAGTDNPLLYLRNPSGSGKTLYVYKTGFGSTVANVSAIFRVFANPTVSANGTSQSIFSLNIGGGAGASSMLVTSTPTVSANGNNIETVNVGQNSNSLSFVEDFSIHVAANSSILITGNPLSNNRNAELTIVWVEI